MGSNPAGRAIFQRLGTQNQVLLIAVGPLWNLLSTAPCGHETIQALGVQNQVLLLCLWDFVGPQSPDPRVRYRRVTPYAYRSGRAADSPASAGVQHQHSHNGQRSNDWRGQEVLRDLRRKRPPLANGTRTSVAGHGREPTAIPRHVGRTANLCCSFCQYAGRETGRPRSDEAIAVLLQLTRRCRSE